MASEAWEDFQIAGEVVEKVERVLDVRQGKLCWVAGTIYMEMPLKPNILEDIGKDVSSVVSGFWGKSWGVSRGRGAIVEGAGTVPHWSTRIGIWSFDTAGGE